jgi:hypothetical protein
MGLNTFGFALDVQIFGVPEVIFGDLKRIFWLK